MVRGAHAGHCDRAYRTAPGSLEAVALARIAFRVAGCCKLTCNLTM